MTQKLLTPDELAERWTTSRAFVLALARGGGLPYVDLAPRVRRFRESDVEAYEATRRSYSPPNGEAETPGQRRRHGLSGARKAKAVGRVRDGGLDAGRPADPKGALRIVRARGEGHAA